MGNCTSLTNSAKWEFKDWLNVIRNIKTLVLYQTALQPAYLFSRMLLTLQSHEMHFFLYFRTLVLSLRGL